MDFGYFTLSDNHYENNHRAANQFIADILDEAVYAEEVGLHSAWIGEHHFSTLGVLSCPDLVLANVAARTRRIRLAPAVTVLPLHYPIRVAEQWATLDLLSGGRVDFAAGRGYDRREYMPFNVSFEDNQALFEEGMALVRRLWSSDSLISHHGKYYRFDNVGISQPFVAAGKLRGLAITGAQRLPSIPDVPTMAEAGIRGLEIYTWLGLFGPANLPPAVLNKLSAEVTRIMNTPEMKKRVVNDGYEVVASTPAQFSNDIQAEVTTASRVIRARGIKAE